MDNTNNNVSPKISVITVCYNAANQLEETIKSVINQNYTNLEYIIIDGKSTDGTDKILNKYRDKVDKIVSEPDNGLYDAMNKGIYLATGDFINFMNAGDVFCDKYVIEKMASLINPDSDVIYGDAIVVNPDNSEVFEVGGNDLNIIAKRPIYRHNASFTKLKLHKKFPFDIKKIKLFGHALDYNHIYSIWKHGAKFQHVNVAVVKYERVGISDKLIKNVILNFRIRHQDNAPKFSEYFKLFIDILRAWRREIIR